jgi:hypothetical protein
VHRHGDIEDILESLAKTGAGFSLGKLVGKHKFGGLDIKRVYFGFVYPNLRPCRTIVLLFPVAIG